MMIAVSSTEITTERASLGGVAHSGTLRRRVFENIAGLLGGRALSLLLSAVTSILLARYLGSLNLGRYASLYAYVGLFAWLATFGLDQIMIREAARRRREAGSILMTGAALGLVFGGLTTLLALWAAPLAGYTGQFRWLLALAALDTLVLAPLKLPGLVFQVDLRQWYGVGIGIIRQVVWLAIILFCASLKASLPLVVFGRAICGVVETALILSVSFRFFEGSWRFLSGDVRTLMAHSAPLAFTALAVSVYLRVDQVLLHRLVNDQELGYYVSAVNLTEVFSALPVAVMASLFPILSQLHNERGRFQRYADLGFRYLAIAAFGVCLLVTIAARDAVQILYGQSFRRAAPMLAVLIWSLGAVFFGVVMSNVLIARNLQRLMVVPAVIGALVNLALNLLAIPRWGGLGAAWATTISYTLAGVSGFLLFPEARPLLRFGLKTFLGAGILAGGLVAILSPLGLPVTAKLLLGGLAYLAGVWLAGFLKVEDLDRAWAATGRKLFA